jgi:hypothetical protein
LKSFLFYCENSLQDCLNIKRNIMIDKILIKLRTLMNSSKKQFQKFKNKN